MDALELRRNAEFADPAALPGLNGPGACCTVVLSGQAFWQVTSAGTVQDRRSVTAASAGFEAPEQRNSAGTIEWNKPLSLGTDRCEDVTGGLEGANADLAWTMETVIAG